MRRVLITGLSGTGKSTVVSELAARGYKAVDTDYDGWSELVDVRADEGLPGTTLEPGRDWLWNEERMSALLATEDADLLFVSGAAPNQTKFYPQFDHIVLLTAPKSVMSERLVARTNNPYGKRPHQLARALALKDTIEPLLRRGASLEVDTSIPVDEVVAKIVAVVLGEKSQPPAR